jgi:hypothetical protein
LRTLCSISDAEEAALRQLALRSHVHTDALARHANEIDMATRQRAAEDVARHGLRACGLPECGATEPQPKAFKVCSRCRRVCYCSGAAPRTSARTGTATSTRTAAKRREDRATHDERPAQGCSQRGSAAAAAPQTTRRHRTMETHMHAAACTVHATSNHALHSVLLVLAAAAAGRASAQPAAALQRKRGDAEPRDPRGGHKRGANLQRRRARGRQRWRRGRRCVRV